MSRTIALAVGVTLLLPELSATPGDAPAKSALSILKTRCVACHGEARMSGLDLRTRQSVVKGGTRGPAIVPGNSSASLLVRAVRHEGDLRMPPGNEPLAASQVQFLSTCLCT